MFRYYKRNWVLAVVALSAGILHQLCTPLVAVMEQKLVDYVVAGNMEAFCESMLFTGLVVLFGAGIYFMDAVMSKRFQVKFEESLRNDIYDSVMRQNTCRFHGMDSTKLMTYVRTNATVIANNFCGTTLTILAVGIMG